MQHPNFIPIVFCFDAGYAPYAAVSTFSLHWHAHSPLKTYWIVPSSDIDRIVVYSEVLAKQGIAITIIAADESTFLHWKEVRHLSRGAYLRLLIPELVCESRAIYLDSDLLVLADLAGLFETPLQATLLAGVRDPEGGKSSKMPRSTDDIYINSGVLLMDLEGLRHDDFFNKCKKIYSEHVDAVTWLDQCLINKYAENNKTQVDSKWNYPLYESKYDNGPLGLFARHNDLRIVHFLGRIKPWIDTCDPRVAEFWWQYAEQSGVPGLHPQTALTGRKSSALLTILPFNKHLKQAKRLRKHALNLLLKRGKG